MGKLQIAALSSSAITLALFLHLFLKCMEGEFKITEVLSMVLTNKCVVMWWISIVLLVVSFVLILPAKGDVEYEASTIHPYKQEIQESMVKAKLFIVYLSIALIIASLFVLILTFALSLVAY